MEYIYFMLIISFVYFSIYLYYKISIQKKIIILNSDECRENLNQIHWVLNRDKSKCQFDWVDITDRNNPVVCGQPSNEIFVVKVRLVDPFQKGNDFPNRSITVCETHKIWLEKSTNLNLALKINLKATSLTEKYLLENPEDIFPE